MTHSSATPRQAIASPHPFQGKGVTAPRRELAVSVAASSLKIEQASFYVWGERFKFIAKSRAGRAPSGQALVSGQDAKRLAPPGFDPSRITTGKE